MFQGRGADFTKSFNDSSSINKYLSDLKSESSDGKSVVDFSYLPGQQEDRAQLVALHAEVAQANERFKDLINSTSWKITAPIRRLKDWINSI